MPAGPPPDLSRLREAAVAHLARFAATETGLARVLARRIDRWARAAEAEAQPDVAPRAAAARALIAEVARAMVAAGAVDDTAFAASRARRLARTGRSRRATLAHLGAKGVDGATAIAALPPPEAELLAALAFCRRRRLGPFARDADLPLVKALGALARAGFPQGIARQALAMDPDEAETLLLDEARR
jgi:regulatory protein